MNLTINPVSINDGSDKLFVQFAGEDEGKLFSFEDKFAPDGARDLLEKLNEIQENAALADYDVLTDNYNNFYIRRKQDSTCKKFVFIEEADAATVQEMIDWYFDRVKELSAEIIITGSTAKRRPVLGGFLNGKI